MKINVEDKRFYKMLLTIAVPMMVQNGLSNFVSLLDNLMIGSCGTNAISGVAISNQLLFVFYLLIFGATAGAGIFTAQYHGKGDTDGVRYTFRFKIIVNTILSLLSMIFFIFFAPILISQFLKGEGAPEDAANTLLIGKEYMKIMVIGLIPVGITNAYAGTLKDIGATKVPMIASMTAILVNLTGNALLIYGLWIFPEMGAEGAAVATVISRFVELFFLVIYTGTRSARFAFISGAFKTLKIPANLVKLFFPKLIPLMCNETLWALGQTFLNQSYSYRSLDAVAALNIESTVWNLLGVAFLAMGEAVGIVMGHILGGGEETDIPGKAVKMRNFTILCGLICAVLLAVISPFFPMFYNTSHEIRVMATKFILIFAMLMPFYAYMHASYFIIRSGGNTFITFLFDSCFAWVVLIPTAYVLSRHTNMYVVYMVALVQSLEVIKCVIAHFLVKSGIWAKNIVK
ncbi:MAG: polysaccharide biosynthesis C-terminal domain-containing protein [Saccharofermentans sp.]|nr:polysaccharide biosynthesis C-terminal domain-containing protein [Saccharofermentans sp.]